MPRPGKGGFDGLTERSPATPKPDIQHRAYLCGTAVLFSVVKAEPAIAVILGVSVRVAVFPAATLTDSRRAFHDCLNAVERRGIGKVHLIAPFWKMKKARSLLQNFGQTDNKKGRQVFSTCLPLQQLFSCTGVQIHSQSKNGGFISSNMHPEIPAFGQQKTPTESGFLRNISFLCSLYGAGMGT